MMAMVIQLPEPHVISQVGTPGLYALSLAVMVAAIYLALVRFMDLNEKEPLWAVGLLFALGAFSAMVMPLFVSSAVRELSFFWGAVSEETAKFVAFSVGAAILALVASSRGWSEIGGLMYGVVYGTAVGFGFAAGSTFIRELSSGGVLDATVGASPFATLWTTALMGLSDGLFGAIIGVGFGAAVGARSALKRLGYPVLGLIGAVLAHAAYLVLARGNALGGTEALVRTWVALLLPLLFVAAVVVVALVREKRAIREELADERSTGVVTEEEHGLLQSFAARRSLYARTLLSGNFDGWLTLRSLHDRQVQLALAKRRTKGASGAGDRAETEGEVERLRAAVLEIKDNSAGAGSPAETGKAGA